MVAWGGMVGWRDCSFDSVSGMVGLGGAFGCWLGWRVRVKAVFRSAGLLLGDVVGI